MRKKLIISTLITFVIFGTWHLIRSSGHFICWEGTCVVVRGPTYYKWGFIPVYINECDPFIGCGDNDGKLEPVPMP
ncbi:MAG: hypothetical protein Greene101449_155 [Candidatus Peregrinibacteria bacterium Greene1014_49]|nr:MAG: hypothetical protein Greene101449_155 [Candidatus Peregrinibacteria bacterium Greene1014_49]